MRTLYPAEDLARLTGVESFAQRETRFAGLRDFVDGPPKAGTLEEQLQAELEDGSGTDEWREWIARAAARHGIKSSGSAAAAARAAASPVPLSASTSSRSPQAVDADLRPTSVAGVSP